jgi:CBS domain-containing protein
MGYSNRSYGGFRDENDFDDNRERKNPEQSYRRGYGDDYRGYSRGYNVSNEPNYSPDYERGFAGEGMAYEPNQGRGYSEAGAGVRRARYQSQAGPQRSHLRCRDVMTRNVTVCNKNTSIYEAARLMRDEDIGALPVVDENGKLAGIVTDRDLVVQGLTSDRNEADLRVEDCMTTDLFTADQNERLVDVIREMGDHQVRRVPVVDKRERLVGIISMADIAVQTSKDRELEEALEEISEPASSGGSWLNRLAKAFDW